MRSATFQTTTERYRIVRATNIFPRGCKVQPDHKAANSCFGYEISRFSFYFTVAPKGAHGAQHLGKFLGKLTELHHGVSGEVYAVDGRTLHIKDFTYDGQGPGKNPFCIL